MRALAILFPIIGLAFALASAFVTLAAWQPFTASPPVAGVLSALSIVALIGFVLSRGRGSDFINYATLLAFIAAGQLMLAADYSSARLILGFVHIAGMAFFLGHRRASKSVSQVALACALVVLLPLIVWLSTTEMLVTLYTGSLGVMAAAAWLSRFSRLTTGLGILLYVAADLVQFAGWSAPFMTPSLREALGVALYLGLLLASIGVVRRFALQPSAAR